jgi:hypothetical protein
MYCSAQMAKMLQRVLVKATNNPVKKCPQVFLRAFLLPFNIIFFLYANVFIS